MIRTACRNNKVPSTKPRILFIRNASAVIAESLPAVTEGQGKPGSPDEPRTSPSFFDLPRSRPVLAVPAPRSQHMRIKYMFFVQRCGVMPHPECGSDLEGRAKPAADPIVERAIPRHLLSSLCFRASAFECITPVGLDLPVRGLRSQLPNWLHFVIWPLSD